MGGDGLSIEAIFADPTTLMGNHVILDHGHGEYSALCHFQRGSIAVRPGDLVRQGQELGRIGYSGSVFTVHLHYELRRGPTFDVDGLPSRFRGVERWLGDRRVPVKDGFIETGDILESR
jgi:murein DD-endopeptidase MepM/ murein hydrolase activator NlpD